MRPPKQVERGESLYGPAMFPGARGLGAPASGGSRRRLATIATSPSLPAIAFFAPGVPVPTRCADLPLPQFTSPVSLRGPSPLPAPPSIRSLPLSVPCGFVQFTNWPDCFTSNDGPRTAADAGAVAGSGAPEAGGGGAPRHATGPAASYPPAIGFWACSSLPALNTTTTTATVIAARNA